MPFTLLEIFGVAASLASVYLILRELWNIFYTSYVGHALGRTISLRNIGQWAGMCTVTTLWMHLVYLNVTFSIAFTIHSISFVLFFCQL